MGTISDDTFSANPKLADDDDPDSEDISPIEQVRLTVLNTDDPSLPVWTFRMWTLGVFSCGLLAFLNQFFSYRTEPLAITQLTVQIAVLPIGRFMAAALPTRQFRIPVIGGDRRFSLNPGPFNMKEHVLISIFANAGAAFGNGNAYAVGIIDIIKAFYYRNISFLAGWLLVITTQVLGYGWAGLMRKYVIEPAHMWWPGTLVQYCPIAELKKTNIEIRIEIDWPDNTEFKQPPCPFSAKALHEKETKRMSRAKFFVIVLVCSFAWYAVPGYLFPTITTISWVCWAFPKSVTAQQLGSGMQGLGLGALTLDWAAVSSFLYSPLLSPFFATVNVFVGYFFIIYLAMPIAYWSFNLYSANKFPIFSSHLFTAQGQAYNISEIVNSKFELDLGSYQQEGHIHLSMFFALTYGFGFATIAATLTHVGFFYGKEIYQRYRASNQGKEDIHTRLMKRYPDIPIWWFYVMLLGTIAVSLVLCIVLKKQVQMPWWGLLFASAMAFIFTLPISIITATTNQTPGINIITEYVMGIILPGEPIANVCFKTFGYMSMAQAVSFLSDFKLGHYMKIPPRSMFLVQFIGTIIAGTINAVVAFWLLDSIPNICNTALLSADSPWTCPGDRVFFDASVIWGLIGPRRIFGHHGDYKAMNWFFLIGGLGPFLVWLLHKAFPKQTWIPLINLPVLLGATGAMPPATPLNYNAWCLVGTIFNFFIFRYRKKWWQRYNYILSAALDAGVAFMGVLVYFTLGMENVSLNWWGTGGEHCPLAACPTAKGIVVDGCPVF
ncbi:Oligopeptide transporter 4-like protein [Drosera capensis]